MSPSKKNSAPPAARVDPGGWAGRWIWHPSAEGLNEFVYFRKTFTAGKDTPRLFLHITAEREYACWVNGRFLGRGPVLSDPHRKRYDAYPLSGFLRKGKNILAAAAYNDCKTMGEKGGFLCQVSTGGGAGGILASSDETFRVHKSTAYGNPGLMFNDSFWPEFYDAGKDPAGWTDEEFDDSCWPAAVCVIPEAKLWGYRNPQSRFHPWVSLAPRDIPFLNYGKIYPASVVSAGEVLQKRQSLPADTAERMSLEPITGFSKTSISGLGHICSGRGTTVIRNSDPDESEETFDCVRNVSVLLDFGEIINARPGFTIDCEEGATIDIGYGTSLQEGRLIPYVSSRTRNADQYRAREGLQEWSSFNWRHFRYLQLTFRELTRPLRLKKVWAEKQEYPFRKKGDFQCDRPILNEAFAMAERTLKLCASDRFMDNPSREAIQYAGDVSNPLPAALSVFGPDPLSEKYFRQFDESRFVTGLYPSHAPGNIGHGGFGLFDHAMYIPFRLWEYYYHTGDRALPEEMWAGMLGFLRFVKTCLNRRGLLETLPYPVWYDWADIDRRGEMLIINALYAETLGRMAELAEKLRLPGEPGEWLRTGKKIRERIANEFFDPAEGVFSDCIVDGKRSGHTSEHSNSLAVLFGGADPSQVSRLMEAYRTRPGIFGKTSPNWPFWLPALSAAGETDSAVEWIEKRFGRLMEDGLSTIPETWPLYAEKTPGIWRVRNSRAEVQSGGTWMASFLVADVAGIRPYKPGFEEILLKPRIGSLARVRAQAPAGKGLVKLSVSSGAGGWKLELSSTPARPLRLDLPREFGNMIEVKGKPLRRNPENCFELGRLARLECFIRPDKKTAGSRGGA